MSISAMPLSEQIRELLQLLVQIDIPAATAAVLVPPAQLIAQGKDAVEQPNGVVLFANRLPEEHLRHRHVAAD